MIFYFDLHTKFQKTYPILPTEGSAQIRIFNTMDCKVSVNIVDREQIEISPLNMSKVIDLEGKDLVTAPYIANFADCYEKGYTSFKNEKGKIRGFKISKNIIFVS